MRILANAHEALLGGHLRGLLPLTVLAVVAEIAWRVGVSRKGYDTEAALATLGVAAGNLLAGALTSLALAGAYGLAWSLAPIRWPLNDWRTWAVGLCVVEFAYYWFHRLSHEVRWLWATHAVHHTPEQITLLSAIRLGWTGLFSGGWLVYFLVVLAGFDPRLVLSLLAVDLHYQFFLHTEAPIRLGPLEWILNTPTHHRLHHAVNPGYLDMNYGGMVIVFDRMFGTFAAERPEDPIRYGLVHPLGSRRPIVLALGEWRRLFADLAKARSVGAGAAIALGRPE